ncbi:M15 family metallopeptidase [Tardiphaga sp. 367_B4_N1_1]|uniref:M15 family metallopeptidase n=1 Tax=Tardiphaga sp. 367_B4_N1_1 TaxID=3240777 RepID=UPI003F2406F3
MALDMASPFVWGSGGRRLTPEEILAERKAATLLGQEAMSTAPVGHWSAGLNRVAQGLMAGYDSYNADQASKQNGAESASVIQAMLGGGGATAPVAPVAAPMGNTSIPVAAAGVVPNDGNAAPGTVGMNQRLADLAYDFIDDNPGTSLSSGVRSTADQARLYADRGNNPNPVAPPGTSKHERGQAVDIGGMSPVARALLPQYGLAQPVRNDPPHVELAPPTQLASADPAALPVNAAEAQGYVVPGQTAAPARPAINPAILKAISSPYVSDDVKKMGMMLFQNSLAADKVQTIDLGNAVGIMDARGNIVKTVPKGEPNKGPEYGVIGKDEFGNEKYGWRDPRSQTVTPYSPQAAELAQPSAIPPAPPGVDPKVWREGQSKETLKGALPGSFDDTHKLRNEFTALPAYKNMAQAAPVYQSMRDAAGRDTKAADLNIVYGLGKIMDPGSVVREGEIQMANNAQGWQEKLNGIIAQINSKGSLTPEGRQALMAEAHSRIMAYKQQYDFDVGRYGGIADRSRINRADVIPDFGSFEPWTVPKNAAPTVIDGYTIKAR